MNRPDDLLSQLRIDRSDTAPTSRRGLWLALGGAAVLLVAGLGLWSWLGRTPAPSVQTVTASPLANSASRSVLDATGYVVARRIATVSAKVTGKVSEILIEEGQRVAAGDVLARLEPIDAEAQLRLAEAQHAAARSQAQSLRAQLTEARANAERQRALWAQKLIARAQFDQANAQRDALAAQLDAADRGSEAAQRQVEIARNHLDDMVVRAPFAGVVVAKAAQPGEIVSPLSAGGGFTRTGIGTLVDMDSLEVQVDVGEAFIGRVKPGMPVEATLNAYPDWQIPSHVIAIIPTADRNKATVLVRIGLDQRDARIVPDMGVKVAFLPAKDETAQEDMSGVRLPEAAIRRDGDQALAFVLRDGQVERRALKLGRSLGEDRQVLAGLAPGDTVVLDPPPVLTDGARVRVGDQP